ncbi:metal ABC transporter ATP-binding protein [Acidithiobacillus sp. IBUN Pt1247-S3]|uniref:metal ABC transporter ATP-binding protein n=1 Tax=Acidithiobacillus sp. IBUN Pt1247-S3 TaxID=3166642 RepID=UPI0034E4755D
MPASSVITDPILAVSHLGVRLGGRQVLRDISFTLGAGSVSALIGENGAGKTTLLRSILGIQTWQEGSIEVLGKPAHTQLSRVGYVPQKIAFDPYVPLRTRDLVALGRMPRHWWQRPDGDAVNQALAAVQAESFAEQRVGMLSGGQQQRAVIAHALARRPRLLLLDEPLANLDFASASRLVRLLASLAQEQGISVLVTAHDMNPLLPVLDHLVYLVDGRAAAGSVQEVVRSEVLNPLYGYPVEILQHRGRLLVLPEDPQQGLEIPCHAHEHLNHDD